MPILKRIIACGLAFVMTVLCTEMSFGAERKTDDDETGFAISFPVAYDTYVRKGYGTNDYSNETTMIVDGRAGSFRMGVMRFRYGSGASESAEAVAETADYAALRLRINQNPGLSKIEIYGVRDEQMKSSWADGEMNYNLADSLGILEGRGSEDIPLLASDDMEGVAASDYLEFDVTDYVKEQAGTTDENGGSEFVFLVCGADAYSSSDYFRVYAENNKGTTSEEAVPRLFVSAGREGYVKRDVKNLIIEKQHQVTEDFCLPAIAGEYRGEDTQSSVEWRSDTESVISLEKDNDVYRARVTRPSSAKHGDAVVTLTAVVRNGKYSESKSFKLYVPPVGVYNPSLTNYVKSSSEETNPNSVVYSYVKGKTKFDGFVKFEYDDMFSYAPKAVLRMKPYFMQGAFTLTMTALDSAISDACSEEMTWKGSQELINNKGMYSVSLEQNPSQTEWLEWDVTDYINSVSGAPVFRFEIESAGTAYCMMYGNAEKYIPQLKLYNYELITDAENAVQSVAEKVRSELEMMSGELSAVTGNINLPSPEKYGVTVTWEALDENGKASEYLSDDGTLIKQPEADESDVRVILKAVIKRDDYEGGSIVIEKDALVLKQVSDEEAVRFNKNNLKLNSEVITNGGNLPRGFYGAEIEWTAQPEGVLDILGNTYTAVGRRDDKDVDISLTAIIKKGTVLPEQKTFNVKVMRGVSENMIYNVRIFGENGAMENTNDDDIETYYASDTDFNIDYAFSAERQIGSVSIVPYNAENIKSIGIYYSDDAENWSRIDEITVADGINKISFASVNAMYLRLAVKTDGGAGGISEAGAYGGAVGEENLITANEIINSKDFVKLAGIPAGSVKSGFKLEKKISGASVKWYSGNSSIISLSEKDGVYEASVKRPVKTTGVKLTAIAEINGTSAEKTFTVSVGGTDNSASLSGGGGGGGGGSLPRPAQPVVNNINSSPRPTVAPTAAPENEKTKMKFTDINKAVWAERYIQALFERGLIKGRTEYEFAPQEPVTREEFAKLIVLASGFETGGECSFSDVPENAWYYPYVSAAYKAGITNGVDEKNFGAGSSITRQDMAVMISRALKDYNIEGGHSIDFNDENTIADYAVESVKRLSGFGVISGDNLGNFNPLSCATRAEVSKIIYMLLELTERG
jgi:hypothetical protein